MIAGRRFVILLGTLVLVTELSGGAWAAHQPYELSKSGGSYSSSPGGAETTEHAYVIGPQNVIQIKIFGEGTVNQVYRVDELGYITHALVGRIQLGGRTIADAEKFLESMLEDDYIINPQVTIFVLEHSRFSVLGEVRRPGTYELLGRVTVLEAISMAGGFTPVANQRDVKILRKSEGREATVSVDMSKIMQQGDVTANVEIEAGDSVIVSKSFF